MPKAKDIEGRYARWTVLGLATPARPRGDRRVHARCVLTACERMAVDANMSASRVGAAFCIPFTVDGKLARVAKR